MDLKRIDKQPIGIARHRMRSGSKPRDSLRYRKLVMRLRGMLKTRINAALNSIVKILVELAGPDRQRVQTNPQEVVSSWSRSWSQRHPRRSSGRCGSNLIGRASSWTCMKQSAVLPFHPNSRSSHGSSSVHTRAARLVNFRL